MDKKRALRLVGESMREAGILIAVFAPLDAAFHEKPVDSWYLSLVVVGALVGVIVGILLETEED